MVGHPFDGKVGSPWGYRILTPQFSYLVAKSGVYYEPKEGPFKEYYEEYNGLNYKSPLYPLIFTNFIFFVLAAFIIFKSVEKIYSSPFELFLLQGIVGLFFLSFSTVVHGISGLTEGGSIFFIALLNYFLINNNKLYFAIFAVLSIFQRELIPIFMLIYIFV